MDRKFVPKLNCQRMVSNGWLHGVMSVVRKLGTAYRLASAFSLLLILMSRILQHEIIFCRAGHNAVTAQYLKGDCSYILSLLLPVLRTRWWLFAKQNI